MAITKINARVLGASRYLNKWWLLSVIVHTLHVRHEAKDVLSPVHVLAIIKEVRKGPCAGVGDEIFDFLIPTLTSF